MPTPTMPFTWLTQESHDRLNAELQSLMSNRGAQGDAAESAVVEARIRQLIALLKGARVQRPEDDGIVEPGMLIDVEIAGETERFLMGSREMTDHGDVNVCSEKSPLGAAIFGMKPGDTARYVAPNGRDIEVRILSARPFSDEMPTA